MVPISGNIGSNEIVKDVYLLSNAPITEWQGSKTYEAMHFVDLAVGKHVSAGVLSAEACAARMRAVETTEKKESEVFSFELEEEYIQKAETRRMEQAELENRRAEKKRVKEEALRLAEEEAAAKAAEEAEASRKAEEEAAAERERLAQEEKDRLDARIKAFAMGKSGEKSASSGNEDEADAKEEEAGEGDDSGQNEKVAKMKNMTNLSEDDCKTRLENNDWDLAAALDAYFSSVPSPSSAPALFEFKMPSGKVVKESFQASQTGWDLQCFAFAQMQNSMKPFTMTATLSDDTKHDLTEADFGKSLTQLRMIGRVTVEVIEQS